MNQKIRFTSGTSTSSESQPVVLKSWQRWMVSMKPTTMMAIQAMIIPRVADHAAEQGAENAEQQVDADAVGDVAHPADAPGSREDLDLLVLLPASATAALGFAYGLTAGVAFAM